MAVNAPEQPTRVVKPDFRELGVSGTRLFAGILSEEDVPALQFPNAWKAYRGMRNDATCSALLKAIELPIRSSRWYINPPSDDPQAVQWADFCHDVLWDFGTQSMDDVLRLALGMMTWGFSVLEILYSYIDSGPWKGKVGWQELAWRSQATRWRWNMDWVGGRRQLVSMSQLAPPFYQITDIPRNKLLLFTNDREGDNYDGQSLLRPAYKDYIVRDRLYRIRAIGLERAFMGVPVASLPDGYSDEMRDLARNIVESLRVDEQAGVIKPEELALEILKGEINGPAMHEAVLYHNRQILLSGLAQFLDLGSGAAGAYALSSDHSELFILAINAKANYVAEQFNLDPGLPSLLALNFAGVDQQSVPRLQHGDIGQRSLDKLGRTLMALGQWGFLTPSDNTERRLREMLDLPELEDSPSDRALYDLLEEAFTPDVEHGGGPGGGRVPSPLVTQAKAASAKAAGTPPGGGPAATAGPQPAGRGRGGTTEPQEAEMAERHRRDVARSRLAEVMARRRWERPRGRLTEQDRVRIQATEHFAEALEDFHSTARYHADHKPVRPSTWLAMHRKPYVVRSGETRPASGAARTIVTRQAALAKRRETQLADLLKPRRSS